MATETKDRREELLASTRLNGIDFVEIGAQDQTTLLVHFLNTVALQGDVGQATITGGEVIRSVAVEPIVDATAWSTDADGRPLLTLSVDAPGDFSFYTLKLVSKSQRLDAFYDRAVFSFKALCPSDLDCASVLPSCPPLVGEVPPIDYLAKDFLSFRKALSDFSALRYPEWAERSEADFGVMFMEALCSVADDLSYTQDRVAAEATLETATQRRSLVRHARLVDYEPQPVRSARVLLQLDVQGGPIRAGLLVSAQRPDGQPNEFETGTGLADQSRYLVNPLWNRGIQPYYWDDSERCLEAGATEMWIAGHGFGFRDQLKAHPEQPLRLLIDTQGVTPADPPVREVVQLVLPEEPEEQTDPLFNQDVTHIVWRAEDAVQFNHDLTKTVLAGNLVPATQGRRFTESFMIPPDRPSPVPPQPPLALCRTGPNGTPAYLYTLRNASLAWLAQDHPDALPAPEIRLTEKASSTPWPWCHTLLEAEPFENAFTVERARYAPIARTAEGPVMQDYDGDGGDALRFGDGVFGAIPNPGTVFEVRYRVGSGALGNVAADSITKIDPAAAALVRGVTNPFAAQGGADEESDERIQRLAPQAFRSKQFRAVRTEDYQAAAQTLPWVQRAGTTFRWTGSWLTVFTTPDPSGSEELPADRHRQLIDLLNRYRLAGYESYVPAPRYVSLDLQIIVCALAEAFRSEVKAALMAVLSASRMADGTTGFFHVDRFTFGTPLERSALESAIQSVAGVAGVLSIRYRRREVLPDYVEMPDTVVVGVNEIVRLDNDPSRPERGSLRVSVEGGR